jgi:hypothetical protein
VTGLCWLVCLLSLFASEIVINVVIIVMDKRHMFSLEVFLTNTLYIFFI